MEWADVVFHVFGTSLTSLSTYHHCTVYSIHIICHSSYWKHPWSGPCLAILIVQYYFSLVILYWKNETFRRWSRRWRAFGAIIPSGRQATKGTRTVEPTASAMAPAGTMAAKRSTVTLARLPFSSLNSAIGKHLLKYMSNSEYSDTRLIFEELKSEVRLVQNDITSFSTSKLPATSNDMWRQEEENHWTFSGIWRFWSGQVRTSRCKTQLKMARFKKLKIASSIASDSSIHQLLGDVCWEKSRELFL